jgi:microcystin-dependent protein
MDPFLGEIRLMGFGTIPKGWAQCNGQLLSVQHNQPLFSLLGIAYGGDGTTTFGVPNLAGRVPLGFSQAYILGNAGGEAAHTLVTAEMPAHSHGVACFSGVGQGSVASGNFPAASKSPGSIAFDSLYSANPNSTMAPDVLAQAGTGAAHDNMQPYEVLNFCIALVGIYPSRP